MTTDTAATVTLKTIFKGVDSRWKKILIGTPELKNKFIDTLLAVQKTEDEITPGWNDILNFAKYPFLKTKVLIIGQDPYPGEGVAHGLSFSTLDTRCPHSLGKIFQAMVKTGVVDKKPTTYNLTKWCEQGVILLNAAWTTKVGSSNSHAEIWQPYVDTVIRAISQKHPGLTVLLWGAFAKSKETLLDKQHRILTWTHPAARVDFTQCPHFQITRDDLGIDWNPDTSTLEDIQEDNQKDDYKDHKERVTEAAIPQFDSCKTWYTDGAAPGNGRKGCKAGWAVINRGLHVFQNGPVMPCTIQYLGEMVEASPTNIRGEGFAIFYAMRYITETECGGQHTIVTDSQFWIDMITKYMPTWTQNKRFTWSQKKNSDLCEEIWTLYNKMDPKPQFRFVKAHQNVCPKDPIEAEIWKGNIEADTAAGLGAHKTP
jgi:uracil-DNA glycosylase